MRAARPARNISPIEPTAAAIVREQTGATWSRARALCTDGRVTVDGQRCLDPAARIHAGAAVWVDEGAPKLPRGRLKQSAIVFVDRDIVVVDKPVGMLSIAYHQGDTDTLVDRTRTLLRGRSPRGFDPPLGVVHRLDKETSGLVVFARTMHAKKILAEGFRTHAIERKYHAIAHGSVKAIRVASDLIANRGDGIRGSYGHFRRPLDGTPSGARHAITHIRPIAALAGATWIECRLETGRQHQIRIHLAELGHPLVGERVYIRDYTDPRIVAKRPMLHAQILGFAHPRTGERMTFEREPPDDFVALLETLRKTQR